MDGSNSAVIDAISSRKAPPTAKRQYRSAELKRQIVEETMAAGCVGGPGGAGARGKRQSSIRLAPPVPARAIETPEPCAARLVGGSPGGGGQRVRPMRRCREPPPA